MYAADRITATDLYWQTVCSVAVVEDIYGKQRLVWIQNHNLDRCPSLLLAMDMELPQNKTMSFITYNYFNERGMCLWMSSGQPVQMKMNR